MNLLITAARYAMLVDTPVSYPGYLSDEPIRNYFSQLYADDNTKTSRMYNDRCIRVRNQVNND